MVKFLCRFYDPAEGNVSIGKNDYRELSIKDLRQRVSHRFSTVKKADRILVLENGTIIENGSHEELMANQGRYAEMFEKQFSWVSEKLQNQH